MSGIASPVAHGDHTMAHSSPRVAQQHTAEGQSGQLVSVERQKMETSATSSTSADSKIMQQDNKDLALTLSHDDHNFGHDRSRPGATSPSALSENHHPSPAFLRPYAGSPTPSSASVSQSNLADSASLASSAVVEDDDPALMSTGRGGSDPVNGKKSSHRLVTRFLSRTQSIRSDEVAPKPKQRTGSSSHRHLSPIIRTPTPVTDDPQMQTPTVESADTFRSVLSDFGAKTAPLEPERGFRSAMSSSDQRNRSADRNAGAAGMNDDQKRPSVLSSTLHLGNKTIDGVRNAGGHMFRKFRTSSVEKHATPIIKKELEVVRLPLAEQVRMTRLAKQYGHARDKTQFWLPALPYRCIDYLNMHAVDEVGIYRQSGSRVEVDRFLSKFDTDPYDVDLLEDPDLYDVHIISSLFKDWLRCLPQPIIPEEVQTRMHHAIQQDENRPQCPQAMKDELSNLPPHNYYLLFAITCHVSLLHSNAAKNLMTFENLVTCFMRSLQVDTSIFKYLILDWRNCWQGCRTESKYLDYEQSLERAGEEQHHASNPTAIHEHKNGDRNTDKARHVRSSNGKSNGLPTTKLEPSQEPLPDFGSIPVLQPLSPMSPVHMWRDR